MKKQDKKGSKGAGKSKGAAKAKGSKVAASDGARIPLKRICQDLGIDPKAARVKLRRVYRREENPGVQFHKIGGRWDLTTKEANEVRAILSN